ncbi:MAG TPA: hypothetical protein VKH41_13750 [Myxococcota bacterium]|nr:hypothetical protein [Myxococcota bacterium]
MNTIWEVRLRPDLGWGETIRRRFLSVAMVFGIGFLLLSSMFVSTLLAALLFPIGKNVLVWYLALGSAALLRALLLGPRARLTSAARL